MRFKRALREGRYPRLHLMVESIRYYRQRISGSLGLGRPRGARDTLAGITPLLAADRFVPGRIVLVNCGLAAGGVERQIVYHLRGLASTAALESVALVCTHPFDTPGYDFYLPDLKDCAAEATEATRSTDASDFASACGSNPSVAALIEMLPERLQRDVRRLAIEFLRRRPEVVHGFQDMSGVAASLAAAAVGVPRIILSSWNLRPTTLDHYQDYMRPAYRLLAGCNRIIFANNSNAGAKDYVRWIGIPSLKFRVMPNGIDTDEIARPDAAAIAAFRASIGVSEGAPLIGSVFRLRAQKRPMLWIDAASEVARAFPDAHFLLLGAGPLRERILRRARRRGIADRLHMPGTMKDVSLAISAMSVFLLTSEIEGIPNVLLEAGLLGVPVVTTEAGGAVEAIDPGRTGWVATDGNAKTVAACVSRILNDQDWVSAARHAAPAFIRSHFGLQRVLGDIVALYGVAAPHRLCSPAEASLGPGASDGKCRSLGVPESLEVIAIGADHVFRLSRRDDTPLPQVDAAVAPLLDQIHRVGGEHHDG